jgi:hypothetical protein
MSNTKIIDNIKCMIFKEGKYWISFIPSLNVSGYGITKQEAIDFLDYNVNILFQDLRNIKE